MSSERRISLWLKYLWTTTGAATTVVGIYDIYLIFTQNLATIISTIVQSIPILVGTSSGGTFLFMYAKKLEEEKLARYVVEKLENTLGKLRIHLESYQCVWTITNDEGDCDVSVYRKLSSPRKVFLYPFRAAIGQNSGSQTEGNVKLDIHDANRAKLPYYLTVNRPDLKRGVIIFDPPVTQTEFWIKYKWKGLWKPLFTSNRHDKAKITLQGEVDNLTFKIIFPESVTNASGEGVTCDGRSTSTNLTTDAETGKPCLVWTTNNATDGDYCLYVNVAGYGR